MIDCHCFSTFFTVSHWRGSGKTRWLEIKRYTSASGLYWC